MADDHVDHRQEVEQFPAVGRQEPFLLVVHQEVGIELRFFRQREGPAERALQLVAGAETLQVDRDPVSTRVVPERIDALGEDVEESLRFFRAAFPVVRGVGQDHVRLRTEAREAVDQGEAVQARIRFHVVFDRHGQRGPRPVRDVVHDEIPYAEERLVRVHTETEGMGKGLPRLGKRSTDRLRRRELQRPLTPGREWRLSVHVVRGFHEALKEVLLEAVVDGLGVDGIRGFQSWFFRGRRRRLRQAVGGHGKNPIPLFPGVIISYLSATKATNCYGLEVSVETMK